MRRLLLVILVCSFPSLAFASSDIGYTFNRGAFSLMVRFHFWDDDMKSVISDEPYRLELTFRELAQWT